MYKVYSRKVVGCVELEAFLDWKYNKSEAVNSREALYNSGWPEAWVVQGGLDAPPLTKRVRTYIDGCQIGTCFYNCDVRSNRRSHAVAFKPFSLFGWKENYDNCTQTFRKCLHETNDIANLYISLSKSLTLTGNLILKIYFALFHMLCTTYSTYVNYNTLLFVATTDIFVPSFFLSIGHLLSRKVLSIYFHLPLINKRSSYDTTTVRKLCHSIGTCNDADDVLMFFFFFLDKTFQIYE